ncbi:hypothetical protein NEUTE2DRAFT_67135 [Neurospora tetrasperma FGSC 2509]|nr:hypothetical protein NEUTE2DRAFT_67135 [Neurospora tetrasperma FGSC 2509]
MASSERFTCAGCQHSGRKSSWAGNVVPKADNQTLNSVVITRGNEKGTLTPSKENDLGSRLSEVEWGKCASIGV